MKGAKVISRFTLSSKAYEKNKFLKVLELLPKGYESVRFKGERTLLSNGLYSKVISKENTLEYRTNHHDVTDIEICNTKFINFWQSRLKELVEIQKKYGLEFYLHYEITIYDEWFPSFYFYPEFIKFLDQLNTTLTLYYYSD